MVYTSVFSKWVKSPPWGDCDGQGAKKTKGKTGGENASH